MSSTQTSNRKRGRASSHREESTAIIKRRTIVTVTSSSSGFESLVDDVLDLILQFVGEKSYASYCGINHRYREVFLSKNLPKKTFFYGYAPLSMIQENARYDPYRLGLAVVEHNRNDILQWLVLEKNRWAIGETFNIAAGVSLNSLKRILNLVGDDAFTSMKITEGWDVSRTAAGHERLDVLNWLKGEGWFDPSEIVSGMKKAAKKGNIPVLEWLIENGCKLDNDVFCGAAEGGHLNMLEFLKEKKCPLDPNLCMLRAATGGSLETIHWLLRNGCSFENVHTLTLFHAAGEGHLHVFKFFIENGVSVDEEDKLTVSHYAAEEGHLHVLKWLHKNHWPFDEWTFASAAGKDKVEKLEWLLEIHCPYDKRAFENAARNGNIDNLQWLLDNNFPWDKQCYSEAAESNNLEVLEWLKEKGCPRGDNVLVVVEYYLVYDEVKDWLRKNGFSLEDEYDNNIDDY